MTRLSAPGFFRVWLGYGGIAYALLAVTLAARAGAVWLLVTVLLGAAWWWESATGFCRRCTHFACGPHGVIMRRFFARDPRPLPASRLILHTTGDLLVFAWPQYWIWEWPWLGAATLVWFGMGALAAWPSSDQARRDTAKFARWGGRAPRSGA